MQKIDIDNLPTITEEESNEHVCDTNVLMERIWDESLISLSEEAQELGHLSIGDGKIFGGEFIKQLAIRYGITH